MRRPHTLSTPPRRCCPGSWRRRRWASPWVRSSPRCRPAHMIFPGQTAPLSSAPPAAGSSTHTARRVGGQLCAPPLLAGCRLLYGCIPCTKCALQLDRWSAADLQLFTAQVQPHSRSWRCLFCSHANDATGALLTDDPQVLHATSITVSHYITSHHTVRLFLMVLTRFKSATCFCPAICVLHLQQPPRVLTVCSSRATLLRLLWAGILLPALNLSAPTHGRLQAAQWHSSCSSGAKQCQSADILNPKT
jgi:hypothetical protein